MVVRLGGYARISLDKDGREEGVERQREDYLSYIQTRPGWTLADDYTDNDKSAYKKNVRRPEFERLLQDLQSGVIDGVVTYDLDRLARQPRDLERLIDIYEKNPKLVFATIKADYNLSDPDDLFKARIMVTVGHKASADAARRIKRKHRQLADQGKNGGGHRAFGWNEDRITINEPEAALILKAHDDLLAGTRLQTIVREWQALDVKTARNSDSRISRTAVKAILTNWRLCGYRSVKGEVHQDANGPVIGEWQAIATPEKLEAVRAVLEETRERYARRTPNGTNAYRYLLSGILRCALCGSRLTPNSHAYRNPSKGTRHSYRCPTTADGGCGKVSRAGEPLDAYIVTLVHEAQAAQAAALEAEGPQLWPQEGRLAEVEQEVAELLQAKKDGRISLSSMIALLEPLEAERDSLKAERTRFLVSQARAADNANLIEEFERLPLERQRAVIMKHIKAVMVSPVGKGARKFRPELVEVVWADGS